MPYAKYLYEMKTEYIYQDMLQDTNLFDTSEYDRDHPLYSTANEKVLGKINSYWMSCMELSDAWNSY